MKRLCRALLDALHSDLGVSEQAHDETRSAGNEPEDSPATKASSSSSSPFRHTLPTLAAQWSTISTLDPTLDAALNGGIPTGTITELAGEAGAGKTQLLLALLLAVQLPPPHGTGQRALYISTEAPLSTRRLTQMLTHNRLLAALSSSAGASTRPPSLDNIVSTTTPDLESQEHILTYQVPVQVERGNIGLIVLDSVAANYRAEFDRGPANGGGSGRAAAAGRSSNMGARSAELVRLGMLLRDLAVKYNLAVVVSNQVADRFGAASPVLSRTQPPPTAPPATAKSSGAGEESPLAARSKNPNLPPLPPIEEPTSSIAEALLLLPPQSSLSLPNNDNDNDQAQSQRKPPPPPPPQHDDSGAPRAPPALTLDHQQRWFTGWGDDPAPASAHGMKTPSLGLVWATQVACRIALFKTPRYGRSREGERKETWRRWAKVVYAPHVAPMGPGVGGAVEFEIGMGGVGSVVRKGKGKGKGKEEGIGIGAD